MNTDRFIMILAEETVQQLYLAGYASNYVDYGFAFDRAVLEMEATEEVNAWNDSDYDHFAKMFAIQACMADVLMGE